MIIISIYKYIIINTIRTHDLTMVNTFEKVRRRNKEQFIFCLKLLPPLIISVVKQRLYLRKQMLEAHLNLNQSMSPDKQGLVDGEPQRADDDDRLVA